MVCPCRWHSEIASSLVKKMKETHESYCLWISGFRGNWHLIQAKTKQLYINSCIFCLWEIIRHFSFKRVPQTSVACTRLVVGQV